MAKGHSSLGFQSDWSAVGIAPLTTNALLLGQAGWADFLFPGHKFAPRLLLYLFYKQTFPQAA